MRESGRGRVEEGKEKGREGGCEGASCILQAWTLVGGNHGFSKMSQFCLEPWDTGKSQSQQPQQRVPWEMTGTQPPYEGFCPVLLHLGLSCCLLETSSSLKKWRGSKGEGEWWGAGRSRGRGNCGWEKNLTPIVIIMNKKIAGWIIITEDLLPFTVFFFFFSQSSQNSRSLWGQIIP